MNIESLIKRDRVRILKDTKKSEVLISLIELAANTGDEINNVDQLKKEVFFREELMSTGIGLGLAIPHVRFENLSSPVICIGVQPEGIYDYESLDDEPVKLVIMILVDSEAHRQYIRILSQITGSLRKKALIPRIIEAKTEDEIFKILGEL